MKRLYVPLHILMLWVNLSSTVLGQSTVSKPKHFEVLRMAEGVYTCTHVFGGEGICNSGVVNMGSYTVVIDPFMTPVAAEELVKWINANHLPPIRYVINSHYHNDHIRGNQVFDESITIISTKQTLELIKTEEPKALKAEKGYAPPLCDHFTNIRKVFVGDTLGREYQVIKMMQPYFCALARSGAEIKTRLPDFTFTGKYVLEDIRRLELMEMGAGHTPNDLVVYLPDDKILFGADLITNQFHAYMPDGDPDGWLSILEKLGSLEVQAVIPGHGIPGDKSLIGITARYISENLNYAKGLPKEMKFTPDDLDKIEVPLQYRDWWLDQFFTDNIRFLHQKINR